MEHNIRTKKSFLAQLLEMYVVGLDKDIKEDIERTDLYNDFKYQFYVNHLFIINSYLILNFDDYLTVCLQSCKNNIKQLFAQYEHEKNEYQLTK